MGRPKVIHKCAGCGEPTHRRGRATDGVRCISCSADRMAESAMQIKMKHGPYYESWLAGMKRAIARQERLAEQAERVFEGDIPWK